MGISKTTLLDTLLHIQMGGAMSLQAIVGTLLPFAGAVPGSIVIRKNLDWYEYIKKPSWMPPEWVYGPVWTLLYAVMGYASHLVYQEGADTTALLLYGAQMGLDPALLRTAQGEARH